MTRLGVASIALLALAAGGVAGAAGGGDPPARIGVLVETTRGPAPAAVRAARARVEALRARGSDAELRVARSPSEALAAGVTLAVRGAARLETYEVDRAAVVVPLAERRPSLRIVRRR